MDPVSPTPTYEISLPPIFTPLPSKTSTTPYIPINGFTTSIRSYAPISENTEAVATSTKPAIYLPSYSPISRSPIPTSSLDLPTPSHSPIALAIKQGLSGGKIAGIVVGAVMGLVLACYAIYVLCWSRRNIVKKSERNNKKKSSEKQNPSNENIENCLERKSKKPSGNNSVDIDRVVAMEELDKEEDKDLEKNNDMFNKEEEEAITFPRFGKYYDPKRRYSPTSPNSDLREDFRSYYKAARALKRDLSSSGGSSSLASLDPPPLMPFYGGFNSYYYYGPMVQPQQQQQQQQQQTPAIYPYHNLPLYTPQQFMSPLYSSIPTTKASTPRTDYFYQPTSNNFAFMSPKTNNK